MSQQPRAFCARIAEHVISNVVAALVLAAGTYMLIAYYTQSLPSLRTLVAGIASKPLVVWRGRVQLQEEFKKSNIFLAGYDRVRSRYQIRIDNAGEIASNSTRVVVSPSYRVVSVRSFGDVELRQPGGGWQAVPPKDHLLDAPAGPLEFRVSCLTPTDHVQIEIVFEREVFDTWQWPTTVVVYECGPAAMGLQLGDSEWNASSDRK